MTIQDSIGGPCTAEVSGSNPLRSTGDLQGTRVLRAPRKAPETADVHFRRPSQGPQKPHAGRSGGISLRWQLPPNRQVRGHPDHVPGLLPRVSASTGKSGLSCTGRRVACGGLSCEMPYHPHGRPVSSRPDAHLVHHALDEEDSSAGGAVHVGNRPRVRPPKREAVAAIMYLDRGLGLRHTRRYMDPISGAAGVRDGVDESLIGREHDLAGHGRVHFMFSQKSAKVLAHLGGRRTPRWIGRLQLLTCGLRRSWSRHRAAPCTASLCARSVRQALFRPGQSHIDAVHREHLEGQVVCQSRWEESRRQVNRG
jgi:hypothetical protein